MQLQIGETNFNPKDFWGEILTVEKCDQLAILVRKAKYQGWKDHMRDIEFLKVSAKRGRPQSVKPQSVQFIILNRLIQSQVNVDFLMDAEAAGELED